MTIEAYHERLQSEIDKIFADKANHLLNSARTDDGRHRYLAGCMDGVEEIGKLAIETYRLFVTEQNKEGEDDAALY